MRTAPMRRSQPKVKTGYDEAQTRYVHHMGSCEYFPAMAWAKCGDRYFAISAEDHPDLEPHQLVAKCEALLRLGAGWTIRSQF